MDTTTARNSNTTLDSAFVGTRRTYVTHIFNNVSLTFGSHKDNLNIQTQFNGDAFGLAGNI